MRWDAVFYRIQMEDAHLPMMRMDVLKLAQLGQERLAEPLAESDRSKQAGRMRLKVVYNVPVKIEAQVDGPSSSETHTGSPGPDSFLVE
ncbi:hypothetical protein CB0940_03899 [Cercospora beticola]|uniref:Uncharacterized protein n=1 Tax=Cercospora beticola TaxID=122368 RepID=A0A2G5HKT5_CERBT|nr:hypothetical protein CB0940_03899 [Cercospora beticola]PIA92822.1 hypothetical protein CB0940_03899 [Cercospora beticola]WPB01101.1 hypothetical protein RHO25_005721 [Cercospora beticola]